MKHDTTAAHKYCYRNRKELQQDTLCGCFYCCDIFAPDEITEWIHEGEWTALCPRCGVDAVLGQYTGYPITPTFLREMKKAWFDE